MANNTKKPTKRKAQKREKELIRESIRQREIAEIREIKKKAAADIARAKEKSRREAAASKTASKRDKQKAAADHKRNARRLKQTGIFDYSRGKSASYARRRVKTLSEKFQDFIDPDRYFFLRVPKKSRKETLTRAKKLGMATTQTGVFYERQGSQKAKLEYSKKRDEFTIVTSRRERHASGKKKVVVRRISIAKIEQLDAAKARIARQTTKFGPLKRGERIKFKIINGHIGRGTKIFDSIDKLFAYTDQYQKKPASMIHMYRHMVIEKTSVSDWTKENKSERAKRKTNKTGRDSGTGQKSTRKTK